MAADGYETDVLVLAFRDKAAIARYADRLDPEFFSNVVKGNLWRLLVRLYQEHRQVPSASSIETEVVKEIKKKGTLKLFFPEDLGVLSDVMHKMSNGHYVMDRWVVDNLDQWISTKAYELATTKAQAALAEGRPHEIPNLFRTAQVEATPPDEEEADFFDRMVDIARGTEYDKQRVIPTGVRCLDGVLDGGWMKGEFGLVFGVESVGKSWLLNQAGGAAVENCRRVLHATNEMSRRNVERRYVTYFSEKKKGTLYQQLAAVGDAAIRLAEARGRLKVQYIDPGATVDSVWGILEAARAEGWPYDLVLVDYMDQFENARAVEDRHYLKLGQVASEFSQISKPVEDGGQDVAIVAVSHADASAYDRRWGSGKLMGGAKVGKNKVLDFGLYLGQDEEDQKRKLVRVTVTKMRERDAKGNKCTMKQDFDRCRFLPHYDD
jgi:KaiC/GvpD/RAD55 family RecA-like ATPase